MSALEDKNHCVSHTHLHSSLPLTLLLFSNFYFCDFHTRVPLAHEEINIEQILFQTIQTSFRPENFWKVHWLQ